MSGQDCVCGEEESPSGPTTQHRSWPECRVRRARPLPSHQRINAMTWQFITGLQQLLFCRKFPRHRLDWVKPQWEEETTLPVLRSRSLKRQKDRYHNASISWYESTEKTESGSSDCAPDLINRFEWWSHSTLGYVTLGYITLSEWMAFRWHGNGQGGKMNFNPKVWTQSARSSSPHLLGKPFRPSVPLFVIPLDRQFQCRVARMVSIWAHYTFRHKPGKKWCWVLRIFLVLLFQVLFCLLTKNGADDRPPATFNSGKEINWYSQQHKCLKLKRKETGATCGWVNFSSTMMDSRTKRGFYLWQFGSSHSVSDSACRAKHSPVKSTWETIFEVRKTRMLVGIVSRLASPTEVDH